MRNHGLATCTCATHARARAHRPIRPQACTAPAGGRARRLRLSLPLCFPRARKKPKRNALSAGGACQRTCLPGGLGVPRLPMPLVSATFRPYPPPAPTTCRARKNRGQGRRSRDSSETLRVRWCGLGVRAAWGGQLADGGRSTFVACMALYARRGGTTEGDAWASCRA